MSSEWQGYDLTEFPELVDPEDTIREALRDTIGDGEGINDAVMQRFIAKVKSDALREAAGIAMEHGRGGLIASDAIIRRAREIEQENAAEPSEPELGEDAK